MGSNYGTQLAVHNWGERSWGERSETSTRSWTATFLYIYLFIYIYYGVAGILDRPGRILREGVAALLHAMKRAWLSAAADVVDHYRISTSYSSTICRSPLSSAARR